jgi:hypothetical protein
VSRRTALIVLLIVVAFPVALILPDNASAVQYTITSLPFTLNSTYNYDTVTIQGTKLSSNGSGITISGHDIVLNLLTDSIVYGVTANRSVGLDIRGYNNKVMGGRIIQGGHTDSCTAIELNNTHDLLLHDVFMYPQGHNSKGINCPSGASPGNYNIEMDGGGGASFCHSYVSRCAGDGNFIWFGNHWAGIGAYAFKVHDVVVDSCPEVGINVSGADHGTGTDTCFIYNCTITVDALNELYTYPVDNACKSAGNAYGLAIGGFSGGSKVYGNKVRSGTSHAGGRGIILSECVGTAGHPVEIYNNDFDCHEGPDAALGDANFVQVYRSRWGNAYIHVHDNSFVARAGVGSSYTNNAFAARVECTNEEGHTPDHNMVIEHNLFAAYGYNSSTSACAMAIESFDGLNNLWTGNTYISSGDIVRMSETNWGCNGALMVGDTLRFHTTTSSTPRTVVLGYYNYPSINNIMRDCVYQNGANDTNIVMVGSTAAQDVRLERTITVVVVDTAGCPISGVNVQITNGYGRVVGTGTTNGYGGLASDAVVTYWYETRGLDSIDYNNFTITATKSTDSDSKTVAVSASLTRVQLTLDNTLGDCDYQQDVIAPSNIGDLTATPGLHHGEINLEWHAPGDDGTSGTADHYVIKYSEGTVNSGTWYSIDSVMIPPVPQPYATLESYTIDNLSEGREYNIAIKAYDEVGNSSEISNVAHSIACGISPPSPLATSVDSSARTVTVSCIPGSSSYSVYYEFALDTVPEFSLARLSISLSTQESPWAVFDSLLTDKTYSWRCRAVSVQGSDSSDWSSITNFDLQEGVVANLGEEDCLSPSEGQVIAPNQLICQVLNSSSWDYIYFQVATDIGFENPQESGPVVTPMDSSNIVEWQPEETPPAGIAYWRASSDNSTWTSPISFTLEPVRMNSQVYAFPVPFRPTLNDKYITFANLQANSDITIFSPSGNVVLHLADVGPGDWHWDVTNEQHNDVATGVYPYEVRCRGAVTKGKLAVIR